MTTATDISAPSLLASVRSVEEAVLAHAAGADIIDCKEPGRGALGALSAATVKEVRARLPSRVPVSATIGDLPSDPDTVASAVVATARSKIEFVKVGFFGAGDALATIGRLGRLDLGASRLVGVLIADRDRDLAHARALAPAMAEAGFAGVMLDTSDKAAPALPDLVNGADLAAFVALGHGLGMRVGLAGALRFRHIPGLLALRPDILGFRGALCHMEERRGALDPTALQRVRAAMTSPFDMKHAISGKDAPRERAI